MRNYQVVFSDIDGTLLDTDNHITRRTLAAVRALPARGVSFVVISARSPAGIRTVLTEYGLKCPLVAYSGGLILDECGKTLYSRGMSRQCAEEVLQYLEGLRCGLCWNLFTPEEWLVKDKRDPRVRREERFVGAQSREGSLADLPNGAEVSKILCMCAEEKIKEAEERIKERFSALSVVRSADTLLEIMAPGVNKAAAMDVLCGMLGTDAAHAVAFGDNYNDVEMLRHAGCGVAMENAPEEVKRQAACVTLDNDHDGIWRALLRLGLADPA